MPTTGLVMLTYDAWSCADIDNIAITHTPVPEPASLLLLVTGLLGLGHAWRRRRR